MRQRGAQAAKLGGRGLERGLWGGEYDMGAWMQGFVTPSPRQSGQLDARGDDEDPDLRNKLLAHVAQVAATEKMKMDELNPQLSNQWFGQQQSNESDLAREVQKRLAEMEKERIERFYPLPTLKELQNKEQEIKAELEDLKRKQRFEELKRQGSAKGSSDLRGGNMFQTKIQTHRVNIT
jgi:hypothetical protein